MIEPSIIAAAIMACCLLAVVRIAPDWNPNVDEVVGARRTPLRSGSYVRLRSGAIVRIVAVDGLRRRVFYELPGRAARDGIDTLDDAAGRYPAVAFHDVIDVVRASSTGIRRAVHLN